LKTKKRACQWVSVFVFAWIFRLQVVNWIFSWLIKNGGYFLFVRSYELCIMMLFLVQFDILEQNWG
jgi:hypothetical protein